MVLQHPAHPVELRRRRRSCPRQARGGRRRRGRRRPVQPRPGARMPCARRSRARPAGRDRAAVPAHAESDAGSPGTTLTASPGCRRLAASAAGVVGCCGGGRSRAARGRSRRRLRRGPAGCRPPGRASRRARAVAGLTGDDEAGQDVVLGRGHRRAQVVEPRDGRAGTLRVGTEGAPGHSRGSADRPAGLSTGLRAAYPRVDPVVPAVAGADAGGAA